MDDDKNSDVNDDNNNYGDYNADDDDNDTMSVKRTKMMKIRMTYHY